MTEKEIETLQLYITTYGPYHAKTITYSEECERRSNERSGASFVGVLLGGAKTLVKGGVEVVEAGIGMMSQTPGKMLYNSVNEVSRAAANPNISAYKAYQAVKKAPASLFNSGKEHLKEIDRKIQIAVTTGNPSDSMNILEDTGGAIAIAGGVASLGKLAVNQARFGYRTAVPNQSKTSLQPIKSKDKWSRKPRSIQDQMALEEAKRGAGKKLNIKLGDPRYKEMNKFRHIVKSKGGRESVIHYIKDPKTGKMRDFKFKKHAEIF